MSLITRCPACGTMFKVVPDQLRISEGWVRCGHCTEIFDASAHMQQAGPVASPVPVPALAPQPQPLAEPASEPAQAIAPLLVQQESAPVEPVVPALTSPAQEPAPEEAPTGGAPVAAAVRVKDDESDFVDAPESSSSESAFDDVSFVRDAQRKAFWRRPLVRSLLAVLCLLLLGGLGVQMAVQERDRIVAAEPRARPVLEALCGYLQCTLRPLRQIESIVIDGSSFNKMRGDAYRLGFTLKNMAALELAMPAIELTLTDTQDQPVIRRVLQPADLGSVSAVLTAGGEWSGSVAISVTPNGPGRIAGYRVLAFYP